jgi:hypothetical protein
MLAAVLPVLAMLSSSRHWASHTPYKAQHKAQSDSHALAKCCGNRRRYEHNAIHTGQCCDSKSYKEIGQQNNLESSASVDLGALQMQAMSFIKS